MLFLLFENSLIGSEFYPREFVHLIVPRFERQWMIEESFAMWNGCVKEKGFYECARILAKEVAINDTINFYDVLTKKNGVCKFLPFMQRGQFGR